eukprot:Amastigsp_a518530_3.p3 type:complete len:101 gc:universal Amastigsp_a518530_3:351-653(+)
MQATPSSPRAHLQSKSSVIRVRGNASAIEPAPTAPNVLKSSLSTWSCDRGRAPEMSATSRASSLLLSSKSFSPLELSSPSASVSAAATLKGRPPRARSSP